jgi:hypothetical protein
MDTASIKISLYNDGPTYFRFDVYSDFDTFWNTASPGAVYTHTTGTYEGGHAVLIIGWDDTKQAWLLKNSWGATGGPNDDGTWWMAYTGHSPSLNFGMANVDASYATPDVLHRDGAIYRATGWTMTAPPYYPGTAYAVRLKTKSDGSTSILHKDGAIWNSTTGWVTSAPPYYPGTAYAKDLEFKSAPALLDEHFEGTFPPTGWQVKNYGSACVWKLNTDTPAPARINYTGGTGKCADADADKCGSGATWPMNTDLWAPPLNLTSVTSATLTFRTAYYGLSGDYASVDVTTNNGSTWTNLLYWTASHSPTGPGELVTLDLTPFCGMNNVVVAFNYYALAWNWYWEVDDVKVVSGGALSTTILHKDGALWNSAAGWTMTTPPYYPGTDYARDLEYRSNGSYVILHKDGAVYDSATTWRTTAPPYYPGTDYARALQFKPDGTNYVILHKDGALWSTDTAWVVTSPPYYPGTGYAVGLEQVGSKYIILHKDGAIYDSMDGWYTAAPPYYPGTAYAVGLEAR